MLRRVILAGLSSVTFFALSIEGQVLAADGSTYKTPLVMPAYNWTGFYIGGHVGWGVVDEDATLLVSSSGTPILPPGTVINGDRSSFLGGGQVGYNWQIGKWILGSEGLEYDYLDFGTRRYTFLDTTGAITNMLDINTNVSAVKVGLNYRWGGPGR